MKDGVIVQLGTSEDILTKPADEYVAKFVEDVDMTKVITAESVMLKNAHMAYIKTDGPVVALHKMRRAGISSIFVSKDRRLEGIVSASDALEAIKRGEKTLGGIVDRDIAKVTPDAQNSPESPGEIDGHRV